MKLVELRDQLREQGIQFLLQAEFCTDERTRRDLLSRATSRANYVLALNRFLPPGHGNPPPRATEPKSRKRSKA